jgi:endonuclease/exonuclease/phosphatase family metal-dependent hydrolase
VVILSWNLFHGRAVPPADRSLYEQFAAKLAQWRWDVALLQEVPPWWPERLAAELSCEQRRALTSRNALPALRRAVAERRPELLKSNGGGCNAILADAPIAEHEAILLRRVPERRVAQLACLGDGTQIVNFHASTRPARAERELERLWAIALEEDRERPLVLGGDLNLRAPRAPRDAGEIEHVAGSGVDHLFARGLRRRDAGGLPGPGREVLLAGRRRLLSDHEPLLVELALSR